MTLIQLPFIDFNQLINKKRSYFLIQRILKEKLLYKIQFFSLFHQHIPQLKVTKLMSNNQQLRLIQSYHQPSQIFTIHDYTKVIYPIDGYICQRQIITHQSKPTFIKIQHQYMKIHSINSYPNLIITLQQNFNNQYMICFYDGINFQLKIFSSLVQQFNKHKKGKQDQRYITKSLNYKIKFSQDNIFILFSLKGQNQDLPKSLHTSQINKETIISNRYLNQLADNQLIIINIKSKRIISNNFFTGSVKQFILIDNDSFTILMEDSTLVEYQMYQNLQASEPSKSYYMMKKKQYDYLHNKNKKNQILCHLWINQELLILNSTTQQLQIYGQSKMNQTIQVKNIRKYISLTPLMNGFLLANQNFLYVYKKVQMSYLCIAQFFIPEIGFAQSLVLSPQQDILSYYLGTKHSIMYIKNFNEEVQNQAKKSKKMTKQLKVSGWLEFKKDQQLQVFVNKQNNIFSITHDSNIRLYNLQNLQIFLQECIESQDVGSSNSPVSKGRLKRLNTMGSVASIYSNLQSLNKSQTILNIAIHPFTQIIAISLKSKIRIYQILYNQLSHLKDINISNCNEIFFSNSGQFLSVLVNGKNGSKCYVYKSNQDYELLECLSIGKKITKFVWSKYDTNLYGLYSNGYYRWSIQSCLKSRFQTLFQIPFKIRDGILNDQKDVVVLYGDNHILQINQKMDKQNIFSSKDVIKISKHIKQILFQNGLYFINFIINFKDSPHESEVILKCPDLLHLQSELQECNLNGGNSIVNAKNSPLYGDVFCPKQQFKMFACTGSCKKNIILLLEQTTKNIKVLEWGKSSNLQKAKVLKNSDLVKIDRKNIKKILKTYKKYEDQVKLLQQKLQKTIQHLQLQLHKKQQQKQVSFIKQIKTMQQKYELVKVQKQKLQHTIQQKIQKHQKQTIKQIKQLEKMYQRKIALTTNKLLTSQEINCRNMLIAEQNLKKLQSTANNDIQKIREQYCSQLTYYMNEKDYLAQEIYKIKKEYQTKLYDLEQQNQKILQQYQNKSQDQIKQLNANSVAWEIKFSQAISKKDNLQKDVFKKDIDIIQQKQMIQYLQIKNKQMNKKCQYLQYDIQKFEKILQQKNASITIYQERINDLEKTNEILKYRVIELKGQTEPQGEQNQKLRDNLNQLEEQYDKIVKSAFEKEQMLSIVKKENQKNKENVQKLESKVKRVQKSYLELIDKVLNITKAPIQEIRKQLINLLNNLKDNQKSSNRITSSMGVQRSDSPLWQLNRIREHLQSCLNEAIDSNKKGQQQKKIQLMKKNRQNSELIKEINQLRKKVRQFEGTIKQKDLQINRILRGDPIVVNQMKNIRVLNPKQGQKTFSRQGRQTQNATQYLSLNPNNQQNSRQQSRAHTRKHTRQTKQSFFQKSLFKSSTHWRQKRLKTQNSQPRNNTRTVHRNTSGKYLRIQNQNAQQQVEDLKRILQQKQLIIKQLINKIQSLS